MENLKELYIDTLKDSYSAETQITKALPKVIEAVTSAELKEALSMHLDETKQHVKIVAELIQAQGEDPSGEHCAGMEGLLKEGDKLIKDHEAGPVRDAALISACQKVEHYEISAYGTLRVYANQLRIDDDIDTISAILEQEENADSTLTEIAESSVNIDAVGSK